MIKYIKIDIEIENDSEGIAGKLRTYEMIATNFETTFEGPEILTSRMKKMIKALNGYNMITISLTESGEYLTGTKELTSYRYIQERNYDNNGNKYFACKESYCHNGTYHNWIDIADKGIFSRIGELLKQGNRRFVTILKEQAQEAQTA